MAVEIELELDASSALGEIGALSLALENLDKKFEEIGDLNVEIGEIGDEIRDLVSVLQDVEVNVSNIADDIKEAAEAIDGASVDVNTPDGETGDGDSSGNDPPEVNINLPGGMPDNVPDGGSGEGMDLREFQQKMGSLFGSREGYFSGDPVPRMRRGEGGLFTDLNDIWKSYDEADPFKDPRRIAKRNQWGGLESAGTFRKRRQGLSSDELEDALNYETGKGGLDPFDLDSDDDGGPGSLGNTPFKAFDSEALEDVEAKSPFAEIGKRLKKLRPSMGKYMQILAALIPMMATFAVEAAGVAAALGAVGAAGAAVMGLGLLGHGSTMADSMAQAKQEVKGLKKELFNVFQPTMKQFAPIQSKFFNWAPDQLQGVADAMEGLSKYENTFYRIFNIGTGTLEELVKIVTANQKAISEMATAASRFIAQGLVEVFTWLLQTAQQNWGLMVQLGDTFKQLAIIGYNVAKAISTIVVTFLPLLRVMASLSGLLNSKIVLGLFTFITTALLTAKVVSGLSVAVLGLVSRLGLLSSGSFISSVVAGLSAIQAQVAALIAEYTALTGIAASAAAAMALTGVGLLAVGAGAIAAGAMVSNDFSGNPSSSFRGGGGQQVVYNDNRSYSIEGGSGGNFASEQRTLDTIKDYNGTVTQMNPPSPGTKSSSSGSSGSNNK